MFARDNFEEEVDYVPNPTGLLNGKVVKQRFGEF